jgi:D-glycero-alpha-D-manno-heptose-7-phosphate kinase
MIITRSSLRISLGGGGTGAKVVGAGKGGSLMFYARHKARLRHGVGEKGLKEVRFRFNFEGRKILKQ